MGSWFSLSTLLSILTAYYIAHMVTTFYKIYSVPPCRKGLPCGKPHYPIGKNGMFPLIQFRMYASERGYALGSLVKIDNDFQLAVPQEMQVNVTLMDDTKTNGSMYFNFLFLPKDTPVQLEYRQAKWYVIQKTMGTAFREPTRTFNLINGEAKEKLPPVTHVRSIINLMSFEDSPELSLPEVPEIKLFGDNDGYYPMLYVAELLNRDRDLVELTKGMDTVNITINYQPVPVGKIRFHSMITSSLDQLLKMGFTQKDLDEVKGIFGDTNFYLLGLTVFISTVHLLFDVLSFKNDISFWRSRESMVGLSTKALLWRCFSYTIVFLYLQDQETSHLVIIPAGVSVLIEFWKLKKALKVTITREGLHFGKQSAEEEKTEEFDNEAMRYMAYLMTPLCIGGAIYSLMYVSHKSWYSWALESMANGVYAFGFLFMLPQLFVNYRLKSVAHLPWRAFTYKAFNTFIDDLFAFIIVMPTAHRVACFRDDIVFLIYLYQRYLYPVDHSRVNEFGQKGEDHAAVELIKEELPEAVEDNTSSEKIRLRKKAKKTD